MGRHRHVVGVVLAAALLAAACSGTNDAAVSVQLLDQQPITDDVQADRQPEVLGDAITPVDELEPAGFRLELSFDPAEIDALVTSSGVPMAVLGVEDGSFLAVAPCGQIVSVNSGKPLSAIQVVIDPGHGGPIDTGAVGPSGLVERDINLLVASATAAVLRERGIEVLMTRTADYAVPLATRALYADVVGAELMVSIHHNSPSAPLSSTPGADVFVQSGSAESARLGGLVHEEVISALEQFDGVGWVATPDTGVLVVLNSAGTDAYGMMAYPATPTALVELAYISNPDEEKLMVTLAYRQVMAVALADAIEAYLETDRPGSGFVDEPRVFNPERAPGADVCENPDLA